MCASAFSIAPCESTVMRTVRPVVSDYIKCACPNCRAKYRLPQEAQGRAARCKMCGAKFKVATQQNLEDSIIDWLADSDQEPAEKPRVINMPKSDSESGSGVRRRGLIRIKQTDAAEEK